MFRQSRIGTKAEGLGTEPMLAVIGFSILAAACAFMLTALYHFYRELAAPPRRAPAAPHRRVITIDRDVIVPRPEGAGRDSTEQGTGGQNNPPTVFPTGMRRLAAKRAARS